MTSPSRRQLSGFVLALFLGPSGVQAQTARTFEELQRRLRTDDLVVVTDETGQKTKGSVVDLSASSLVLAIPTRLRGARETRTFAQGTVTEIRASDSVRNGALIGAAAGAGLAVWDYLIDPSEPGNAAIFTVAIGLGTAIGAGIDALTRKVLFVSLRRPPGVEVLPLFGRDRLGARVVVDF